MAEKIHGWDILNVTSSVNERNDLFGHFFTVTFKMRFSPGIIKGIKEMPKLEWKESISMIHHHDSSYWQYDIDQYYRNPKSNTFFVWLNRYAAAFDYLQMLDRQENSDNDLVKIYKKDGTTLSLKDVAGLDYHEMKAKNMFPIPAAEGAKFIRDYIGKYGAVLEISVVDTPALTQPTPEQNVFKERLVTFDCGFKGSKQRISAWQYLIVNSKEKPKNWLRHFVCDNHAPIINYESLQKVTVPDNVSRMDKKPLLSNGEYL